MAKDKSTSEHQGNTELKMGCDIVICCPLLFIISIIVKYPLPSTVLENIRIKMTELGKPSESICVTSITANEIPDARLRVL